MKPSYSRPEPRAAADAAGPGTKPAASTGEAPADKPRRARPAQPARTRGPAAAPDDEAAFRRLLLGLLACMAAVVALALTAAQLPA